MAEIYHTGNNLYINPTYVVSVPEFGGNIHERSTAQEKTKENLRDNRHKGQLSDKARMRMKNSLNWLCVSAKAKRVWCKRSNKSFWFKISFLTLTIPPQSEKQITSSQLQVLLHAWFMYAKKYFYLRNYVWKVESHADGRLHVHITSDSFIHYRRLRDSWNQLLKEKGFLERHFEKHRNYDPNSTDIHAVKDIKNIVAYIAQYMAKKTSLDSGYSGRIWSCNYNLSTKNKCSVNISADELSKELRAFYSKDFRTKRIMQRNKKTGIEKCVADLFFMDGSLWNLLKGTKCFKAYNDKRFRIRNDLPDIPPGYYEMDFELSHQVKLPICETETNIPKIGLTLCAPLLSSEQSLNAPSAELSTAKQLQLMLVGI